MIYWVKFEGKLFFDPECTGSGPLLQTPPLNMSDLGEALVFFRGVGGGGGGGGGGGCAIYGLNRYVPTEGYCFQGVYITLG